MCILLLQNVGLKVVFLKMNDAKCVGEPEGWRKLVDQDGNVVNLDLIKALRQDLLQARLKIASYEEKLHKLRVKLKIDDI